MAAEAARTGQPGAGAVAVTLPGVNSAWKDGAGALREVAAELRDLGRLKWGLQPLELAQLMSVPKASARSLGGPRPLLLSAVPHTHTHTPECRPERTSRCLPPHLPPCPRAPLQGKIVPRFIEVANALMNINALLFMAVVIVFFDLPDLVLAKLASALHAPAGSMATAFVFSVGCALPWPPEEESTQAPPLRVVPASLRRQPGGRPDAAHPPRHPGCSWWPSGATPPSPPGASSTPPPSTTTASSPGSPGPASPREPPRLHPAAASR